MQPPASWSRSALPRVVLAAVVGGLAAWWTTARPAAWGPEGHRLIASIALQTLSPEAKSGALALLGEDDFVQAATWADTALASRPDTARWHTVGMPLDARTYDPARDCAMTPAGDCLVAAIDRERHVVADRTVATADRKTALEFLINLTGDLHEPMRCVDPRIANLPVVFDGPTPASPTTLLALWESDLMARRGLDEAAYLAYLLQDLKTDPVRSTTVDVARWAEDCHRVAVQLAVGALPRPPDPATTTPIALPAAYLTTAQQGLDRQLEVAGVHLAALLDEAFGTPAGTRANPADEWTGVVVFGMMAVGGETTGIVLRTSQGTFELQATADQQRTLRASNNQQVTVRGTLQVRQGVEVPTRRIIVVSQVVTRTAGRMPRAPGPLTESRRP